MAVNFYLEKRTDKSGDAPIRVSIQVCGVRVLTSTGYSINPNKWDADKQRVRQGNSNARGITYNVINSHLISIESEATIFENRCLSEQTEVTKELIRQNIKTSEHRAEDIQSTETTELTVLEYFDMFVKECGRKNDWTTSTYTKFASVRKHISGFKRGLTFDDFDENGLTAYVSYLRNKLDMRNTTIGKQIGFIKWFLRWADEKGYNPQQAYRAFRPKLKGSATDKQVVFLTWDELMTVYNFPIPESKKYLDRVRDVFCFCCFTSLRYSDVLNLKRGDIRGDKIYVTTVKTDDTISIELNDYSRTILDKYKDIAFENGKVLPVISNQKMNDYIKELGKLCGIDTPIRETYYKGNQRQDEYYPKYELMGTHTGRRTFICNALMLGIPAQVVMKWTGHSDYKSMKPYIDVADSAKAEAMKLFNQKK